MQSIGKVSITQGLEQCHVRLNGLLAAGPALIVGSVHCILHQDLGLELGFLDCHILELLLPLQLGLNSSELVLELGDLELELLVLLGGATVCRRRRRTKTCKHATFSNVWDSASGHQWGMREADASNILR